MCMNINQLTWLCILQETFYMLNWYATNAIDDFFRLFNINFVGLQVS